MKLLPKYFHSELVLLNMLVHSRPVKIKLKANASPMRRLEHDEVPNRRAKQRAVTNERTGRDMAAPQLDEMTEVKLWENPCWLTYRLNYLALRYNVPLYTWVEQKYGLSRPDYVVIYSLGLKDGSVARDIAASSGFPKNTLSRAIHRLVRLDMIARTPDEADRRRKVLTLTERGRALFDESLPRFVTFERMMLEALSKEEQDTLSRLMAKMVLASPNWPSEFDNPEPCQSSGATSPTTARHLIQNG